MNLSQVIYITLEPETRYDVSDFASRAEFDLHALHLALPLLEENLAAVENQSVIEDEKKSDK